MVPEAHLVEADLFISFLTGDDLEPRFNKVVSMAKSGDIELLACSEVYDDVTSALRSQGVALEMVGDFIYDMRAIPHRTLPVTVAIAREALDLYRKHGGSRKLHYFDSFHVATAKQNDLPLITSDRYIVHNAEALGIEAADVRTF
jgi:predicted nucleic acid-binding protein